MAVSCKIEILQVKQLSCAREFVFPLHIPHWKVWKRFGYFLHGTDFTQLNYCIFLLKSYDRSKITAVLSIYYCKTRWQFLHCCWRYKVYNFYYCIIVNQKPIRVKRVTRVHSFGIFSAKYHIWKPLAPVNFAREHWWYCVTVFLRTDWLNASLLLFQIWYLVNWILRSLFPSTQGAVTRFNPYGFLC